MRSTESLRNASPPRPARSSPRTRTAPSSRRPAAWPSRRGAAANATGIRHRRGVGEGEDGAPAPGGSHYRRAARAARAHVGVRRTSHSPHKSRAFNSSKRRRSDSISILIHTRRGRCRYDTKVDTKVDCASRGQKWEHASTTDTMRKTIHG